MEQGYTREREKLLRLADAAALVAEEFVKSEDRRAAEAAQVLFGMILSRLDAMDGELDKLIDRAGM